MKPTRRTLRILGAIEWALMFAAGFTLLITLTNPTASTILAALYGAIMLVSREAGRCAALLDADASHRLDP